MTTAEQDYKAFVVPIHPDHGVLLLYCTRKKSKGPHHQLPGGRVDPEDFDLAVEKNPGINGANRLLAACQIGAARELFEETGIDLRAKLDRLNPIEVCNSGVGENELSCELEQRTFFSVDISDGDLRTTGLGLVKAMNKDLSHFMLKLSHEHQGFVFEPSLAKVPDMLEKHSRGKITMALKKAIELGSIK